MKKNIFLVTWFTSENYGTCLQSYATHRILTEAGNRVCFLNRRLYYPITKFGYFINRAIIKLKARLFPHKEMNYGNYSEAHKRKVEKTNKFVCETYERRSISSRKDVYNIDSEFDCYLVGSDQMWNPYVISLQYLLDFIPNNSNKPRYAYAASFGVDFIPKEKEGLYERYLPKFNRISVREENAVKFIKNYTGVEPNVVLDPTMLLTPKEWREFSLQSEIVSEHCLKDYILCYFLGANFDHLSTVKKIASKLSLKIAVMTMKDSDYLLQDPEIEVIADACAYDFVDLIDNAKLVCTDSFHAVVFSFQMDTPFYYFPRFKADDIGSQDSRIINIMKKFSLSTSNWNDNLTDEDIKSHLITDYASSYDVLERERLECKDFLLNMIEGIDYE